MQAQQAHFHAARARRVKQLRRAQLRVARAADRDFRNGIVREASAANWPKELRSGFVGFVASALRMPSTRPPDLTEPQP